MPRQVITSAQWTRRGDGRCSHYTTFRYLFRLSCSATTTVCSQAARQFAIGLLQQQLHAVGASTTAPDDSFHLYLAEEELAVHIIVHIFYLLVIPFCRNFPAAILEREDASGAHLMRFLRLYDVVRHHITVDRHCRSGVAYCLLVLCCETITCLQTQIVQNLVIETDTRLYREIRLHKLCQRRIICFQDFISSSKS